jgi:hypothetical protein
MTSDMGQMFNEWKKHKKVARAAKGEENTARIKAEGIKFRTNNGGVHLILTDMGAEWDFWPTTGRWRTRTPTCTGHHRGFGVDGLIKAILGNRVNACAYHGDIDGDL